MSNRELDAEVERYVRAMNFACVAHAGQTYGECPYVRHLAHVENVLLRFGFQDFDLLTAAWLHDCVEDAGVEYTEIMDRFGDEVGALVYAVTDGEGANRRERKAASYVKMIENPKAIILKLADRIANVESSLVGKSGLVQMYAKEYSGFRDKLYTVSFNQPKIQCRPRVYSMWSYLNGLVGTEATASASALSQQDTEESISQGLK